MGYVGKDWEGIRLPEVDTSKFDETETGKIRNLLKRHASSFPREDEIGFSDTVQYKVNTYDDSPVSQPYRRIPPSQLMEVKAHIQKLLDQGVIKPTTVPMPHRSSWPERRMNHSGCAKATEL